MASFDFLRDFRRPVAIDVGTAFLRIATERSPMVTIPATLASTPLMQGGVVLHPSELTAYLRAEVIRSKGLGMLGPAVLTGVPTDARDTERKALLQALCGAGAGSVRIVPEPLAAAVGANLDISLPYAQMVVDVGEGVTDCIVLRSGSIVRSCAQRVGCGTVRERVRRGMESKWNSRFSRDQAERMVTTMGVDRGFPGEEAGAAKNRECNTPDENCRAVRAWAEPAVEEILSVAGALLREVPADIGSEIIESGILLTGGGALIPGLPERLAAATSIRVSTPDSPLETVVKGLHYMMTG